MNTIAFLLHLFAHFLYASECHAKVSSKVHTCGINSSTSSTATVRDTLLSIPKAEKIREWSQYYTKESHWVGQGYKQAEWTRDRWDEFGIPMTNLTTHKANLTSPSQHRVALLDLKRGESVVHEAALIEDGIPPVSDGDKPFLPAFFAWAPEGNTTGQYVFANFGLAEDYQDLLAANVSIRGKIAVVKTVFGSQLLKDLGVASHRDGQLVAAAKHGISGLLVYTDPQTDGNITEKNGYQPFPDGPARPPSLIERGSFYHHDDISERPIAMPISYADAIPILQELNGYGPLATGLGERWQDGGLGYKGVNYNVGPSPDNLVLNVYNSPKSEEGLVHNVIGRIPGECFPDEVIILGNHRDAWGPGAGDAASGSTALNEVARSLGEAISQGWRPWRTIVLASWEGEEIGQVGSTPWILENLPWLNATAFSYLNVVVSAAGSEFHAQGSPLLARALQMSTNDVSSISTPGKSMLDIWGGHVSVGGAGDTRPFLVRGISSVDIGFDAGPDDNPFPYHSLFDSDEWMDQYGDPGRVYQLTLTKIWLLTTFYLTNSGMLPVITNDYAQFLQKSLKDLQQTSLWNDRLDVGPLDDAIRDLNSTTIAYDQHARAVADKWARWPDQTNLLRSIQHINRRYRDIERQLIAPVDREEGHLIIPSTPYYNTGQAFPKITTSIKDGDWATAEIERDLVVKRIREVIEMLDLAHTA